MKCYHLHAAVLRFVTGKFLRGFFLYGCPAGGKGIIKNFEMQNLNTHIAAPDA